MHMRLLLELSDVIQPPDLLKDIMDGGVVRLGCVQDCGVVMNV